jgi:hypothetical protein
MRARMSFAAALAALATMLVAPGAQAQSPTPQKPLKQTLAMSGKSASGSNFRGTYTIQRFARSRSGRLVAVGALRGRVGGRRVARGVTVPAALSKPAAQSAQIPQPIPGACDILVLDLRPITIDLLGLVIRTSRIVVRIDAVPGAGNLLGNLLCGLTGILDPARASTAQRAAALNALLALVPRR